jgi:hypothetical protein
MYVHIYLSYYLLLCTKEKHPEVYSEYVANGRHEPTAHFAVFEMSANLNDINCVDDCETQRMKAKLVCLLEIWDIYIKTF